MNLKNYNTKEILAKLETRFSDNSLTSEELRDFCEILTKHFHLFYQLFWGKKEVKKDSEKLTQEEQEKVDKFLEKFWKKKD